MTHGTIRLCCAAALAGGVAASAQAQLHDVRIIKGGREATIQVDHAGPQSVRVVVRAVAVPSATVAPALADQPVHPNLIEVQVNNTTVYLDPDEDYEHQHPVGVLDRNHFIPRAQRLARALGVTIGGPIAPSGTAARIIYGKPATESQVDDQPVMIIPKPAGLPAREPGKDMPSVPAPPAANDTPQVAVANPKA